ncbi:MAG: transcriptional repressor LexA [Thermoleophilia bacterium]
MKSLTSKQQRVLNAIKEFSRVNNRMPTRQELANLLGYKSPNSIQQFFKVLKEKGYLDVERNKRHGLAVEEERSVTVNVPLVGSVSCGTPLLAEENIEAYLSVEEDLVRGSNKHFFLTAHGDSMNLAHIEDGDLLLIESKHSANPGDIILALIGDEATVKFFMPNTDYIALVPKSSNEAHQPIILTSDFTIQGVVRKVISMKGLNLE